MVFSAQTEVHFPLPHDNTGHEFASALCLCEIVKGTYTVLCFTSWERLKIAGSCPSRTKDKAQLIFLVTDKWKLTKNQNEMELD